MQDRRVKICMECAHGRQRFNDSCYCVKYGIIIGYSKTSCRGYDRDEIRECQDGSGREDVRQQA